MWQINERNIFCGTKTNNISSSLPGLSIDLKFYKSFLNKFVFVEGFVQLLVPQTIEKNEEILAWNGI